MRGRLGFRVEVEDSPLPLDSSIASTMTGSTSLGNAFGDIARNVSNSAGAGLYPLILSGAKPSTQISH
jgi:hypothetical protein